MIVQAFGVPAEFVEFVGERWDETATIKLQLKRVGV
jgi:hypothetical protein